VKSPDIHWFVGLPGIGKTSSARGILAERSWSYIESDSYRENAWREFVNSSDSMPEHQSKELREVYAEAILTVAAFVDLHVRFSPFLVRSILDQVSVGLDSRVVIEASILHSMAIPSHHEITVVRLDRDLHEERLSNSLSIDKLMAERMCWTYTLSEFLLSRHALITESFELDIYTSWLPRFE
jgi:hypothetical protein